MKGINIAKDQNTLYLSLTCENEEEQDRLIELIKVCLFKEIKVESLQGAMTVERNIPKPLSTAKKVVLEEKKEKSSCREMIPVGDISVTEDVSENSSTEWHNNSVCPICGGELSEAFGRKFCSSCGIQTEVFGYKISDQIISELKENKKSSSIHFNSTKIKDGHLYINGKGKVCIKADIKKSSK